MSHRLAGRSVATAATAGHAAFQLWNPHATQRITLREFWTFVTSAPAAGAGLAIRRTTARGTPGSTQTPVLANDTHRGSVSVSVSLLDLAVFTVQPTLETSPNLWQWSPAAVAASGVSGPIEIDIPPGTGLAWVNIAAVIFPASDISVAWTED